MYKCASRSKAQQKRLQALCSPPPPVQIPPASFVRASTATAVPPPDRDYQVVCYYMRLDDEGYPVIVRAESKPLTNREGLRLLVACERRFDHGCFIHKATKQRIVVFGAAKLRRLWRPQEGLVRLGNGRWGRCVTELLVSQAA
jgi:hypothetical protein